MTRRAEGDPLSEPGRDGPAERVLEVTGGKPEVVYNPRNEGGVKRMRADLTSAEQLLGYHPAIDLKTGLRMTFDMDKRIRQK